MKESNPLDPWPGYLPSLAFLLAAMCFTACGESGTEPPPQVSPPVPTNGYREPEHGRPDGLGSDRAAAVATVGLPPVW